MSAPDRERNSNPPHAESQVGFANCCPGLTEFEARQMIQKALGRLPEFTIKQILKQTGISVRRLAKLQERLKELRALNEGRELGELVEVAAGQLIA